MFLPKSKYTVKQATWGMYKLEGAQEGEFYVGPYIEDYLGNLYPGNDIEKAGSIRLFQVEAPGTVESRGPVEVNYLPTEEAYESGSYIRYFRQNTVSRVIEEISEDLVEEDGPFKVISGSWIVTGSLDDRLIYGIPYRGVRYRNQQRLLEWEKEIPEISKILGLKPEDFVREIKLNP